MSGGPGSLLGWAVSLWAGDWLWGRCRWLGVGGGGGARPSRDRGSRQGCAREEAVQLGSVWARKASGVFLPHWVHCVSSEAIRKDSRIQPEC